MYDVSNDVFMMYLDIDPITRGFFQNFNPENLSAVGISIRFS